jgi:plastocyanin
MRRTQPVLASLCLAAMVAGCGDKNLTNLVANTFAVRIQDQCDAASFNAAVGAGTCTKNGSVTYAQFQAQLAATHSAAEWQFVPSVFTVVLGQTISATNYGGEVHTFTKVAVFGGGIVPQLNTASGYTVVAPECQNLTTADNVLPGATFTTHPSTVAGTERYQCCIHPWMRATVAVTGP